MKAGIPVARGKVVKTIKDARRLIKDTGYPLVAKPDIGVGAAKPIRSTMMPSWSSSLSRSQRLIT